MLSRTAERSAAAAAAGLPLLRERLLGRASAERLRLRLRYLLRSLLRSLLRLRSLLLLWLRLRLRLLPPVAWQAEQAEQKKKKRNTQVSVSTKATPHVWRATTLHAL
jgi:hypothetical protein